MPELTSKKKKLTVADADGIIRKEGWLQKQGNIIPTWRSRWVQIKNGCLFYYKDVNDMATNFFQLTGCRVSVKDTCFELRLAGGQVRYFDAQKDCESWVKAILEESMINRSVNPQKWDLDVLLPTKPHDFEFHKVLGKGNYGKVCLATLLKDPKKRLFAVKIVKKDSLIDDDAIEHILSENATLHAVSHPFLVKLYTSFQTPRRLVFVMEYIRGGELFYHSRDGQFSTNQIRYYAAQIFLALSHLHSRDIVYRDLKLENILLDVDGYIKIADFGLCKSIGESTSTFCGTPEYIAPEIIEDENYGKPVDWWAFGVVLYELCVGQLPFGVQDSMEVLFQMILTKEIEYPDLPEPTLTLLQGLLQRDPKKRLMDVEIRQHEYFKEVNFEQLENKEIKMEFIPMVDKSKEALNFDPEFTQMDPNLTPCNSIYNEKFQLF